VDRGRLQWSDLIELGDALSGQAPGRGDDDEILLVESLGLALFDIAAGRIVLERALKSDQGRELPLSGLASRVD
jgi:ornithine cyclodeaminase/alanine dehydrogenase-like protein (mu-crystallin family)